MNHEPESEDPRLVPMTHADLSWLWVVGDVPQRREALARINKAYDVRPVEIWICPDGHAQGLEGSCRQCWSWDGSERETTRYLAVPA